MTTIMKQKILFALIMGLITTSMISFVLIAINVGFNDKFITFWLRSWLVSYLLVVPSMLFIAPRVQVLANYLTKKHAVAEKDESAL
jgi:hypothetical protein